MEHILGIANAKNRIVGDYKRMESNQDFISKLKSIIAKAEPDVRGKVEQDINVLINNGGTSYDSIISIVQNEAIDLEVRSVSCWVLGNLRERKAEETLIRIFKDTTEPQLLWEISKYFTAIQSKKAAPVLLETLAKEKSSTRRLVAIYTIGGLRIKSATEPLLKVLTDSEETNEIRCHAAESLGLLRNKASIKGLVETLKDKSPEIRYWSMYAIGEIGDSSAIPQLKYIASNDDASIANYGSLKEEAKRVIELLEEAK